MPTAYFVSEASIVRRIWGKSDTILFIFAGASAEFALNKAVDWLYFTGRLPADPIGRLFSTVKYARAIIFSGQQSAYKAIDAMAAIHSDVESKRGAKIPDWAYRDVLFMLIDYSIRSFEVLERKLTCHEKTEVFEVFNRVGRRMGLVGLPQTFDDWEQMRAQHLLEDLQYSRYTGDLFLQYKKHLGALRYRILTNAQTLVAPAKVRELLGFRNSNLMKVMVALYKVSRLFKADALLKALVLPARYVDEIRSLDVVPGSADKSNGTQKSDVKSPT